MTTVYCCNDSVMKKKDVTENGRLQTSSKEQKQGENEAIELNNGVKWKIVPGMMQYLRNMESDVNHFSKTQRNDLKDFTQIADSLQKNIVLLTSNCTMEGKAHDELHKWLLPYIDMVANLNNSKNGVEALRAFQEIETAFKTFNVYFE